MVPVKGFMINNSSKFGLKSYSGIGKWQQWKQWGRWRREFWFHRNWNKKFIVLPGQGIWDLKNVVDISWGWECRLGTLLESVPDLRLPEVGNVDAHGWTSNRCDRWGWAEEVESIWGREISKRGTGSSLDLKWGKTSRIVIFHLALTVRRPALLLPLDPTEPVLSSDAVRVVLRVDELGA